MGLDDLIRSGIATARTITLPLHVSITHRTWIAQSFDGTVTYTNVTRKALVERKQRLITDKEGRQVMSSGYVGILEEITPNGAAGRQEPVDTKDRITTPDGIDSPVLRVDGFFDGGTGVPFYSQVWLG